MRDAAQDSATHLDAKTKTYIYMFRNRSLVRDRFGAGAHALQADYQLTASTPLLSSQVLVDAWSICAGPSIRAGLARAANAAGHPSAQA